MAPTPARNRRAPLAELAAPAMAALPPGRHNFGGGLSLTVSKAGARSWSGRTTVAGKQRNYGLGAWPTVHEPTARAAWTVKVAELRPPPPPVVLPAASAPAPAPAPPAAGTFGAYVERVAVYRQDAGYRDADGWLPLMSRSCAALWAVPVNRIRRADLLDALVHAHHDRGPTVPKVVLAGMRAALDEAIVDEVLEHNPADGKAIKRALRRRLPEHRAEHRKALPRERCPAFVAAVQRGKMWQPTRGAILLAVLTACRRDAARRAQWSEFDLDAAVWTIPVERTKNGSAHRVPLSRQALAVVEGQRVRAGALGSPYVFATAPAGKPLSKAAALDAARRAAPEASFGPFDMHGFRASFRTWGAEQGHDSEVLEHALGHQVGSAIERSYQHSDLLKRRRTVMQEWADYVMPQ